MRKILLYFYILGFLSYWPVSAQGIKGSPTYGGKIIVTKLYHYGDEYRYNPKYLTLPELYFFDVKLGIIINFEP
ncbi:MAG: hypothetical protein JW995_07285 [Melioribacteraceae bacterium]|nr:hypothetical protein [Melioribacteraceae bacterium]